MKCDGYRIVLFGYRSSMHLILMLFLLGSCSLQQQVIRKASRTLLSDTSVVHAHLGVLVVDCNSNDTLFSHNASRYFVPASNVKLLTLYAGLKFLPTVLPGIRYKEIQDTLYLIPTGDPTLLHRAFQDQPVIDFLKQQQKVILVSNRNWKTEAWGKGWSWDDYRAGYMAERSSMPVYGNTIRWSQLRTVDSSKGYFDTATVILSDPEINWNVQLSSHTGSRFQIERSLCENQYQVTAGPEMEVERSIPFSTRNLEAAIELLKDTLHKEIFVGSFSDTNSFRFIQSHPSDSLFRYFMHYSDNLFAEQTLLMVSNQVLGYMNEHVLLDTFAQTILKSMPQQPVWVDGSGLSRYNLMTPENFVWLLSKLKQEFGMERLRRIFPGIQEGTLRNFFISPNLRVFAKTGTLSGHTALTGYLYTQSNRLFAFSIMVNHYGGSSTSVKRALERFLTEISHL